MTEPTIEGLILSIGYFAVFACMFANGMSGLPSSPFVYVTAGLLVSPEKGEMVVVDCTVACSAEQISEVPQEPMEEPVVDDFIVAGATISQEVAKRYVEALRMFADERNMLSVHMFGSVAVHGYGRDLDLVVEVPEETFVEFSGNCIGALDGFHPIEKALLPMYSMYWDYYSPVLARLHYILEGIGVSAEHISGLAEIIPEDKVDMLCLPVGWNTPGRVYELLEENFGDLGGDPKLLKNISDSCVQMTQ